MLLPGGRKKLRQRSWSFSEESLLLIYKTMTLPVNKALPPLHYFVDVLYERSPEPWPLTSVNFEIAFRITNLIWKLLCTAIVNCWDWIRIRGRIYLLWLTINIKRWKSRHCSNRQKTRPIIQQIFTLFWTLLCMKVLCFGLCAALQVYTYLLFDLFRYLPKCKCILSNTSVKIVRYLFDKLLLLTNKESKALL